MSRDEKTETKERLLQAGLKSFAERGYDGSTFRDICDDAEINVASINYHFNGKENFYSAVRDYARDRRRAAMQPCWEAMDEDPWRALKLHIEMLLDMAYDETMFRIHWFFMRELLESPSNRHSRMTVEQEEKIRGYNARMSGMLAALLGSAATPQNINLLRYTYHSLCLFLPIHKQVEEKDLQGRGAFNVTVEDKSTIAGFIFDTVKRTVEALKNNGKL